MDLTDPTANPLVPIFSSTTLCPDSFTLLLIGFLFGYLVARGKK